MTGKRRGNPNSYRDTNPARGLEPAKPDRRRPAPPASPPRQRGVELLFGHHAVKAALFNPRRTCLRLWHAAASAPAMQALLSEAMARGRKPPVLMPADRAALDRMTQDAVHQGMVLEALPVPPLEFDDLLRSSGPGDLFVLLDQVTDPHNIGAIIRSAAAFGAKAVIQTDRNSPAVTGILAKTASGGLEQVALVRVVNLARAMRDLREEGYWITGFAEEGGKTLAEAGLPALRAERGLVLALGAEGEGLRRLTREHCDDIVRLPTSGPVASLNVSNATAIALYEAARI